MGRRVEGILCGIAVSLSLIGASLAADLTSYGGSLKDEPIVPGLSNWFLHLGPAGIVFDSSAKVAINGATVPGGSAHANDNFTGAFEVGYYLTPNIALGLTAGYPPLAVLTGAGTLQGAGTLGKALYGPAILTAEYHIKSLGAFQPYAGIGVNYTIVLHDHDDALHDLHVQSPFGFVVQGGAEYMLSDRWGLFFDVKHIWLSADASGYAGPAYATAKVTLDPTIIHGGISYKF